MDRRRTAVLALCLSVLVAGCAGAGLDADGPGGSDPTPTPDRATPTGADHAAEGTLEVHVINVGQADATLLRTDEETMLVDSGDWRDDGEAVIAYLESLGVDRIDHLVSTHGHADHIGGHEAVIDHYEAEKGGVGAVYDSGVPHTSQTYERYLDAVERHDVDLFEVRAGDAIPFDGAAATVLNPADPVGDDLHEGSVAVHVRFGATAFLFTGDAERETESRMLEAHGESVSADVYQAGHHGSNTSSGPSFLEAVDPEMAVVSAAYDSRYGHPHDEPLERFAERGIETVWTGVHGTVVFESDGEAIAVHTQHDATTDPRSVQDAPAATDGPAAPVEERFVVDSDAAGRTVGPGPTGVMGA